MLRGQNSEAKATRVSWHVQVLQIWNEGFDIFRHKKEQQTWTLLRSKRVGTQVLYWTAHSNQLLREVSSQTQFQSTQNIGKLVISDFIISIQPADFSITQRQTRIKGDNKNLSAEHDRSMNTYETTIQGDEQRVEHRYAGWHFNFQNSRHEDTPIHISPT